MKEVEVMGVFLGQLPPAELARLKAELAETLIAHFCYPRFFDYRSDSLRTRPVDRAKRQEVWLYLSSVDFTAWSRVDLMSPDFQHYIERLIIHFVQRNRSFFGEQGRKRMGDLRMLIGSSALSVAQGLRGHLSGNPQKNPPFGSPRPVSSWSTMSITGRPEPVWDQIAPQTLLLQQQIQESRGEIKSALPLSEARPAATNSWRSSRVQAPAGNISNGIEHQATSPSLVPVSKSTSPGKAHSTTPASSPKSAPPVNPERSSSSPVSMPKVEPVETRVVPVASPALPVKSPGVVAPPLPAPEKAQPPAPPTAIPPLPTAEKARPAMAPAALSPAEKAQPAMTPATLSPQVPMVTAGSHGNTSVLLAQEDIAIFEQLRYQLIVWLRVQAVRSGMDISNQGPLQLLELLRKQDNCDEPHLQIVSTLLNLANQIIKNGQASQFDYKQALMFHLMHTKR
jgi:hypothetical protein